MTNLQSKRKIAAIVPALNEANNIGRVLKVLLKSKNLDEIILVDDGSHDETSEIGKKLGAKVITLAKNEGKGNALRQGINSTKAEIVVFFDADLVGLSEKHIYLLLQPILENKAEMSVGIRDRWQARSLAKFRPFLAMAGERAISRSLFKKIPEKFSQGYAIETALNYYCFVNNLPVSYINLKYLNIIIKEKKWGIVKGFANRIKMSWQILKTILIILFFRNTFLKK